MNDTDSPSPWPDWFALPGGSKTASEAAFSAAQNLAEGAQRLLRTSRALASAGRPIDLTGLHLCIGRLTASILDLDPDDGCRLRPALQGLLFDLDRLQATLEASGT